MTIQDIIKKNLMLRYEILRTLYLYEAQNKRFELEGFSNEKGFAKEEVRKSLKFLKDEYLIDYIQTASSFLRVRLTSEGSKLVEEIELAKKSDNPVKKKVINWAKDNVSWIAPIIVDLVKG